MITAEHSTARYAVDADRSSRETPTVFVVDPDLSTGQVVSSILEGCSFNVQSHASGRGFFAVYDGRQPGCLVSEQRISDTSGLQIQRRLAAENKRLPMIYVSSSIDVSTAVALMRGGAVDVLEKPVRSIELYRAIHEALALDNRQRQEELGKLRIREAVAALTHKERQLLSLLATATSTKAMSAELSIGARAVELRRRGAMQKLGLESSLELTRFALLARGEIDRALNALRVDSYAADFD